MGLGIFFTLFLLAASFGFSVVLHYAKLGLHPPEPPPPPPPPEPETIYYIVEKKKKKKSEEYGSPKPFRFRDDADAPERRKKRS